jgi:hypothetical protein
VASSGVPVEVGGLLGSSWGSRDCLGAKFGGIGDKLEGLGAKLRPKIAEESLQMRSPGSWGAVGVSWAKLKPKMAEESFKMT